MIELKFESEKLAAALLRAPDALTRHMDRAIERAVQVMARSARNKAAESDTTGQLKQSIQRFRPSPFEGVVAPGADYARAVEEGTGVYGPRGVASGKMPTPDLDIRPMLDWVKGKRLSPNDPNMDQEDLAWIIARSIAHSGTPPQPFLAPALEENRSRAERLIEAAIDAALKAI